MTDNFDKANRLTDELLELLDNTIVLSSCKVKESENKSTDKAIIKSRGNALNLAIMLKTYLERNKELAACLKVLDFMPNIYEIQEVEDDKGAN